MDDNTPEAPNAVEPFEEDADAEEVPHLCVPMVVHGA
jgi:hypothetical protein